MLTFATRDDAQDLNSNCAFCLLEKFKVVEYKGANELLYTLERCVDPECKTHCKGHHQVVFEFEDGCGADNVEIVSGWNT